MSDKLPNPERGCGHLERGKAYIRGIGGSGDGILPPFVRVNPPIPYREIGTQGSFTRSFETIDGITTQIVAGAGREFEPLYPEHVDVQDVYESMVPEFGYESRMDIPNREVDRHIDRLKVRTGFEEGETATLGGESWGHMDVTSQTDLLMRAGESYYPEMGDFIDEAVNHGLSKAIPVSKTRDPPTIIPGVTRCWVMSPSAGEEDYGGAVIGYAYIGEIVFTEPEDGSVPAYIEEMEQNGKLSVRDIEEPEDAAEATGPAEVTIEEALSGDD